MTVGLVSGNGDRAVPIQPGPQNSREPAVDVNFVVPTQMDIEWQTGDSLPR